MKINDFTFNSIDWLNRNLGTGSIVHLCICAIKYSLQFVADVANVYAAGAIFVNAVMIRSVFVLPVVL